PGLEPEVVAQEGLRGSTSARNFPPLQARIRRAGRPLAAPRIARVLRGPGALGRRARPSILAGAPAAGALPRARARRARLFGHPLEVPDPRNLAATTRAPDRCTRPWRLPWGSPWPGCPARCCSRERR